MYFKEKKNTRFLQQALNLNLVLYRLILKVFFLFFIKTVKSLKITYKTLILKF
jgi:hypothetical protein